MYRATIYQRTALDQPQIADIKILSASISEDLTQKASSTLIAEKALEGVGVGDLLKLYDSKGSFFYWGVVTAINGREITCSQFQGFYNDNMLLVAQTSANQKAFYENSPVSNITDFYLKAKEMGYQSIANTMSSAYVPTFSSLRDVDVSETYKNVIHRIFDTDQTHMPYPLEKSVKNLEEYLYDTFNTYSRLIRPFTIINDDQGDGIELPSEYIRLSYLESTGSQHIPTGITGKSGIKTEIKLNLTDVSGTIMGAYNNSYAIRPLYINSSKFAFYYRSAVNGTTAPSAGVDYTVFTDLTKGAQYMDVNGVREASGTNNTNFSSSSLYLFGFNNGGSLSYGAKTKVYYCKIWDGDTLVRHLIPARRRLDDVLGMYDLVSESFIAGSGAFIAGEEVIKYGIGVVLLYPSGTINYDGDKTWDYNAKTLFDTWEMIKNVKITEKKFEYNTVAIYNDAGTTLRGAYTVLNDGSIVQISTGVSVEDRYGVNKTAYVFDATNKLADLARANLPSIKYNHEIVFDIDFLSQYRFTDFSLGMPVIFHSGASRYDSILTAWRYNIDQSSDAVMKAEFTLGKVRKNLTSIFNLKR